MSDQRAPGKWRSFCIRPQSRRRPFSLTFVLFIAVGWCYTDAVGPKPSLRRAPPGAPAQGACGVLPTRRAPHASISRADTVPLLKRSACPASTLATSFLIQCSRGMRAAAKMGHSLREMHGRPRTPHRHTWLPNPPIPQEIHRRARRSPLELMLIPIASRPPQGNSEKPRGFPSCAASAGLRYSSEQASRFERVTCFSL
jgi:hypothetical protein